MHLLQTLTWQQFLIVALILTFAWYGWVWWKYYRKPAPAVEKLPHRWQETTDNLLGEPAPEPGVAVVSTDDYGFAGLPAQEVGKDDQLGLVPDLKEDVRSICKMIAEEDGSKEEFFSMFGLIRAKYPLPALSSVLPELNAFIREQVPFTLLPDELDGLWA